MKPSIPIKSITCLKAHAAEIIREVRERGEPVVITQKGKPAVVIQDIESYERTQETFVLLKILALGRRQIEEGKVHAASDVIKEIRERARLRRLDQKA